MVDKVMELTGSPKEGMDLNLVVVIRGIQVTTIQEVHPKPGI